MAVSASARIDVNLEGTGAFDTDAFDEDAFDSDGWIDVSADVVGAAIASYGIQGNGPTDGVASTGELRFDLDNSASNSGGILGWYSAASASRRSGWGFGVAVRFVITYAGVDYVRFYGKVSDIRPDTGLYRGRRVHVVVYDAMRDLIEADAREVAIQISKMEDELITAVLDVLPTASQPLARSLDAGLDVYPVAFDKIGKGTKAASVLRDVVTSAFGVLYVQGDGTLVYKTRAARAVATSAFTLSDDMVELQVPSSLDSVFNRVRATIHPKTIDAAATTVLYALTGTAPRIAAGETLTVWGAYRDPADIQVAIGGTEAVTPIVATTDYLANSTQDGSGANLTANLSISTTAFASTGKFVITNNGTVDAYLTRLQVRGKGIYDNGPQTFESYEAQDYGDRPIEIDMPYQDDSELGQSAADYVRQQFSDLTTQVQAASFYANKSAAKMVAALTLEPTSVITISETVSGIAAIKATIQRVELRYEKNSLWVRWGLAPAAPFAFWQLGVAGASELGVATILAF